MKPIFLFCLSFDWRKLQHQMVIKVFENWWLTNNRGLSSGLRVTYDWSACNKVHQKFYRGRNKASVITWTNQPAHVDMTLLNIVDFLYNLQTISEMISTSQLLYVINIYMVIAILTTHQQFVILCAFLVVRWSTICVHPLATWLTQGSLPFNTPYPLCC